MIFPYLPPVQIITSGGGGEHFSIYELDMSPRDFFPMDNAEVKMSSWKEGFRPSGPTNCSYSELAIENLI